MAQGVIRPLQDGGCSICRASDENVGKRKCRHILSEAVMTVEKEGSTNFVDIDSSTEKFSIKATEEDIKTYISTLSQALTKEQKEEILNQLR